MELESPASKTKRIAWIDLAKCFAIFGVLVDHTKGILYSNPIITHASFFSVSLFILTMGITTYGSLNQNKIPVMQYLWKRTKNIAGPYIIATIINCTLINRCFVFQDIIAHLIHFDACLPYYYVILYLQLLWISPLVFKILMWADKIWKQIIVFILIVILSALTTNRTNIIGIYGGGGKLFGGTFLILLFVGMFISKHYSALFNHSGGVLMSLIMCTFWIGISFLWNLLMAKVQIWKSLWFFDIINPPGIGIIVYSILVLFTLYYFEQLLERLRFRHLLQLLKYFGRNTLAIFLYFLLFRSLAQEMWVYISACLTENTWAKRVIFLLSMVLGPILLDRAIKKGTDQLKQVYGA